MTADQFLHFADLLPEALFLLTGDGTVLAANRGAVEHLGVRAFELAGRRLAALVDTPAGEPLAAYLRACSRTRQPVPGALVWRTPDGRRLRSPCEGAVLRARAPGSEALLLLRLIPQEALTSRFLALNQRLDELARLYHEVREADRRKDQFLAMLAHELCAPLAPLLTSAQVLRQSSGDPRSCEQAADIVQRQVRHLSRLVDDLLQISRLQRNKVELRTERLDLSRLVRLATEDRRSALEQAGLALTLAAPETPVWVRGDPTRLAQVVNNLLDNAQKFTDPGGGVAVRLTTDAGARQAALAIADTGMGIAPDELPHIFEAFAQADRSLDRSRGGLGLGLALVKGLVALHGGEVAAHSAGPGRGADFVVRLPLEDEPAALAEMAVAPAQAGTGRKVVVIEDNRDAAESLRVLLELLGYNVQVAYTGLEGVRLATAWRPDAVISDIGLPGLNGYGVAEALRRHPATAQTLLIALTGYGSDEDRRLAQASGFDHHVTKPADPTDLHELLARPGTPGTL